MTEILLITIYCFFFALLLRKLAFFQQSGVSYYLLLLLFGAKVTAGILYGFIHKNYFSGGDTFLYFAESQQLAATFSENPLYCLRALFGLPTAVPANDEYVYPSSVIFWKDLGTYFIIHINAALIPFSAGFYAVHVVFMSFLGLVASVLLYKSLSLEIKLSPFLLVIGCFLLPSLLFWTAGIHKDVFLFLGLSLSLWALQNKRWVGLLAGLLLMGLTRHYTLLLMLPALLGFWAAQKQIKFLFIKSIFVSSAALLLVACLDYFCFNDLIINILANKQKAFINENGNSDIYNLQSFSNFFELISQLPVAFTNVVARPFIWECKHIFQLLASVEMGIFWGFSILMICFGHRVQLSPTAYFMLFFSLGYLFLIGFLVANEGTMVRYRAIPISFLIILVWQAIDFAALGKFCSFLLNKKRNGNFKTYP